MAFRDEMDHVSSADEVAADWDRDFGSHGSPELDADATKLLEMGADPGVTLEDLEFTQDDGGAGDDDDLVY